VSTAAGVESWQRARRAGWALGLLGLLTAAASLAGCSAHGGNSFALPRTMEAYAEEDPRPGPPPEFLGKPAGPTLDMVLLDVGQGDSLLVRSPAGHTILVDAGVERAAGAIVRALGRARVRKVDLFIATHVHDDHVAGLPPMLERVDVAAVLDSGYPAPGPVQDAYRGALEQHRIPTTTVERGTQVRVSEEHGVEICSPPDPKGVSQCRPAADPVAQGRSVPADSAWRALAGDTTLGVSDPVRPQAAETATELRLTFFAPHPPFIADSRSNVNANSMVFRMDYGDVCMIHAGDAEAETENRVLAEVPAPLLACPLLKVAHHGGRHSSTDAFLDAVSPKVAIVSAGRFNRHGHPSPETLRKLFARKVWTYRTDKMGDLRISTDGHKLHLAYERTREYWRRYTARRKRR